jgi:hypothetical protein
MFHRGTSARTISAGWASVQECSLSKSSTSLWSDIMDIHQGSD